MSLVPYAAGEVNPFLVASMVPEAIKDAQWAAKKIGRGLSRAYKAKKARQTRKKRRVNGTTKVGEPVRHIHTKREQTFEQTDVGTDTRTLYFNEITLLGGGSGEDERHRQLVNCKGFELAFHYYHTENQPMFLNVAVIAPKHTAAGVGTVDFFRSPNGDRGENFGIQLSGLEMHYYPINTDKYSIIRHYRYQCGPRIDGPQYNSDTGNANYISRKFYIPINRQLRYENTIATSCSTPIYLCWWTDRMRTPQTQAAVTGVTSFSFMKTMFYTDVL